MTAVGTSFGCPYCGPGNIHLGLCPRIVAIEYHPNGQIKRVELAQGYLSSDPGSEQ